MSSDEQFGIPNSNIIFYILFLREIDSFELIHEIKSFHMLMVYYGFVSF